MKLVATLEALNLPALLANAQHRIILHAAIYSPFGASRPHHDGLLMALDRPSFQRLDAIALADKQPWTRGFMQGLRAGSTPEEQAETIAASTTFLRQLKTAQPDKVHISSQVTIPCLPIIIVDNTLLFGQYSHCPTHAAHGLWGTMQADVETLLHWAIRGNAPPGASPEDIAAFRLVYECFHAITAATIGAISHD